MDIDIVPETCLNERSKQLEIEDNSHWKGTNQIVVIGGDNLNEAVALNKERKKAASKRK